MFLVYDNLRKFHAKARVEIKVAFNTLFKCYQKMKNTYKQLKIERQMLKTSCEEVQFYFTKRFLSSTFFGDNFVKLTVIFSTISS